MAHDFAMRESMDQIKKEYGTDVDYMRIRAYPFAHEIHDFMARTNGFTWWNRIATRNWPAF